jgi:hypothetical protein
VNEVLLVVVLRRKQNEEVIYFIYYVTECASSSVSDLDHYLTIRMLLYSVYNINILLVFMYL